MSNKHATGRSGTHHAKTRRRAYPAKRIEAFEGDPTDGIWADPKFGKRGNARHHYDKNGQPVVRARR